MEWNGFSSRILGLGLVLSLIIGLLGQELPRKSSVDLRYPLELASLYRTTGRNDDAERLLDEVVASGIRDSSVLARVGEEYRLIANFRKSIPILEEVHKKDPENQANLLNLARSYGSANRNEDAIAAYKVLTELEEMVVYFQEVAPIYLRMGEIEFALENYQKVVELEPSNWQALYGQAEIYTNNKMYLEAEYLYMQALELNPLNLTLRLSLGSNYMDNGEFDKAIDVFYRASDIYPGRAEPFYQIGLAYFKQGLFEKAISPYEEVIEVNDRFIQAYIDLGKIYLFYNDCRKAIYYFEKAMYIGPQNYEVNEGLQACGVALQN
jgi:tetratricopeptide (TPR) repeat protein